MFIKIVTKNCMQRPGYYSRSSLMRLFTIDFSHLYLWQCQTYQSGLLKIHLLTAHESRISQAEEANCLVCEKIILEPDDKTDAHEAVKVTAMAAFTDNVLE